MGEVGMKGENKEEERRERKRERKEKRWKEIEGKRETSVRCGGRQVSGCTRFTLAFANGDILRRKGENESLLSSG